MKAVRIDLAPRGRGRERLLWGAAGALAGLAIVLAWHAGADWQGIAERVAAPPSAQAPTPPTADLIQADAAAWVRLSQADAGAVLAAVEVAAVPGLRATQLEVDAETRRATLEIEARDNAVALAWFDRLRSADTAIRWQWVRVQAGPGTGIRGVVTGAW